MPAILPFDESHIAEAIRLWRTTDHIGMTSADEPSAIRAFLERNPSFSFVAMQSHALVATALCGHDGRRGYIYHLAVVDGHRRSGLGSKLPDSCLTGLARPGIHKCHAFVHETNPYAELFWQPKGWECRHDLRIHSSTIGPSSSSTG